MPSTYLRRVTSLTERLDALAVERDLFVSRALVAGATWAEVADALGVTLGMMARSGPTVMA